MSLDLTEGGLDLRLFKLLSDLIPLGGRLMVEYGITEETHASTGRPLQLGIPPVLTPIGYLLWRSGFRAFKDWYFPEGWREGETKLQGDKLGLFFLIVFLLVFLSSGCLPKSLTTPERKGKPKPKPKVVIIAESAKKRIVLTEPRRGEKIKTPVHVVGRIKGEIPSDFEVQIRDSKGAVLGQAGTLELGWQILRGGKDDWTDFSFDLDFVPPMITAKGELYAYLEGIRGGPFEDELSMEVTLVSAAENNPAVLVKRIIIDRGWATGPEGFGKEAGKWVLEVKSKTKTKAVIQTGPWATDAIYEFELEKQAGVWQVVAEEYKGL